MPGFGGTTVATLIAKLEAQTRQFDTAINQSDRNLRNLEAGAGRAGQGINRMSNLMRGAAAAGLVAFGTEMFQLGVQVEAWGRRFDTVFGEAGASVRDWADEMNERLGMSEERLQGVAAATGDLFVPMGFARQAAAELTTETLTLAAALSEWTGGTRSAEEAANIITRAILGEREALIGLGVKISEADVQNRLAAKGMDELTGAALEQARAQVTLELITEKSTDALTAFADGGSDAMRAQNEMKAAMDGLKITISSLVVELAPAITGLAQLVGLLSVPFQVNTVPALLATADALRVMTLADLEAVRANDLLYEALLRVKEALGGKAVGGKGGNAGAKGGRGGFGFDAGFHSGGMIPGATGMAVPILAMAGERVVPAGQSAGGGGGSVNVYVAGSVVAERELVDMITRAQQANRIRGGSLEL